MKYFMLVAVTLLLTTGALFAQGLPAGGATTTIMLKTDKGLFALRSGVLIKSDAVTLKQLAEFQIFGTAPTMPADRTDQTAMQDYRTQMQKRLAPALMFVAKDSLIVVIGDGFWRINEDTLTVAANTSLAPLADPNAVAPARPIVEPVPGYLLDGSTLYLMRSKEELAINITDGTILARAALPVELQPVNLGGGRGNRGGGTGTPGGAPPAGAPGGAAPTN